MRTTAKQILWPVRGVEEIAAYHDATPDTASQTRAYASPYALNVRTRGPIELRERGGSRPGMKAVTGVTTDGGGRWLWPDGSAVLWPDGKEMTFSSDAVFYAPDGSRVIDLHAVPGIAASKGDAPTGVTVATIYRARLFAAKGSDWFCSRLGDTADWDYGADIADVARACAGNVALAGRKGDAITAFMPVNDSYLYIATARSLWCISGDPCNGSLSCVSTEVGVSGAAAWCFTGSRLYFLSDKGLFGVVPGEHPFLLSSAIPRLRGYSGSFMCHDPETDALHVFTDVPATGNTTVASDWYVELGERPAFWPASFATATRPVSACRMTVGGVDKAAFVCADGAWRVFDESVACEGASRVAFGPFRVSASDDMDGFLAELHVTLAEQSANMTAKIWTAHSAERAAKLAIAGTGGASFAFAPGWNAVWRPRVRGAWAVLVLECETGKWAFEAVRAICKHLGRLRP